MVVLSFLGPNADEIAKRFLESGQQLSPKSREEAVELMKEPRRKGQRRNGLTMHLDPWKLLSAIPVVVRVLSFLETRDMGQVGNE